MSDATLSGPMNGGGQRVTRARAIAGRALRGWNVEARIGALIVAVVVLVAILAPVVSGKSPIAINPVNANAGPSWRNPFGTDNVGRDVLARALYGTRLDLLTVFVVTYVGLIAGVLIGIYAGYKKGWIDGLIGRIIDSAIAFPFIILVLVVITITGSGLKGIAIGIVLIGWALYARLARSEMASLREEQWMLAAKSLGYSDTRIIFRHALPNVIRSCLVYSTVDILVNMLVIASMSYLGFGAQEPEPDLGGLIASGQPYLLTAWWITTLPGIILIVFGFGISLVGDGLSRGGVRVGVR